MGGGGVGGGGGWGGVTGKLLARWLQSSVVLSGVL